MSGDGTGKGWWVSRRLMIAMVVGAAVVATGIALAVYFLHPDRNRDSGTPPAATTTPSGGTTQPPGTTTTTAPPNMRLPTDLLPYHYNVRIRPDIYAPSVSQFILNSSVEIFFTAQATTKHLVLHAHGLFITEETITVQRVSDNQPLTVDSSDTDAVTDFFSIHMVEDMVAGESYKAFIHSVTPIRNDLEGIFFNWFVDDTGVMRYLAASFFQPTMARNAFPCFDEPWMKATFDIIIERSDLYTSYSNTQISLTVVVDSFYLADIYTTTPIMSTFLLAFMVTQMDCARTSNDLILIEVCARPELLPQTDFAMKLVGPMQEFYEDYHNETYPMPQLDHVAIPQLGYDAMENWGLVIYRESALLYDPLASSVAHEQKVAGMVAHELAHMWFGNLVTPAWWDDLWLSEGMATYMQELCMDFHYNYTWMMDSQFVVNSFQPVMNKDSLTTSHPVQRPVIDPTNIPELFDDITYTKGAAVIRMIHHYLGDDIFRWGIRDYLDDRKFQVATHEDLFAFLTQKASEYGQTVDVSAIMNTWILQTGYPVVTFSYDAVTGLVTLSQKHFLLDFDETGSADIWQVPITVVDDMDTDADWDEPQKMLLTTKDGSINVKVGAKWIVGNPNAYYYYRVNYDDDMWDALIEQLENGTHTAIRDTSRAQIIDDSFALGRAGEINELIAMRISDYLDHEDDYTPWVSAVRNLDYIGKMFQLSSSKDIFGTYMQTRVLAAYNKVGWVEAPGEPHLTQLLRVLILDTACRYGLDSCITQSSALYQTWIDNVAVDGDNAINPIDINLRDVVYCSAIRQGGGREWSFAYDQYLKQAAGEKDTLLRALSCADEGHLLSTLLDIALEEEFIERADLGSVVQAVAAKENGRFVAWNFLRYNWDVIFARLGHNPFNLPGMILGVAEAFSTEFELNELQAFMDSHSNLGVTTSSFLQALENTNLNIRWRATNEQKVVDWIESELNL